MSRNYDNWERLVAAVLKKEELWQLFHEQSRSPSMSSESSSCLSFSFNLTSSVDDIPISFPSPGFSASIENVDDFGTIVAANSSSNIVAEDQSPVKTVSSTRSRRRDLKIVVPNLRDFVVTCLKALSLRGHDRNLRLLQNNDVYSLHILWKVVLKLDFADEKIKQKAMKKVSSISGLESIALDIKDKKLTVTGDINPVAVAAKLRKLCHTDIVSFGPAKEPEKNKEEPKKEEPKKAEPKKEEPEKEAPKVDPAQLGMATGWFWVRNRWNRNH